AHLRRPHRGLRGYCARFCHVRHLPAGAAVAMRNRPGLQTDEGFTLVELLIAMVIMGTAIAALVTAMGGLVAATTNQQGHAVNETVVHDFGQAVNAKAVFATQLATGG